MNTEDEEFERISWESKRRKTAIEEEDDDTQTYTSESAEEYLYRCGYEAGAVAEREACANLADSLGWVNVDHIRARGTT